MLLRLCAISLATAACAEPVVEMQIVLPSNAQSFDSSCVTAVTVIATGADYANDRKDMKSACKEIDSHSRLAGVHDAIRGKFTLTLPDSGLSGIQMYGWSGPAACDNEYAADLIFQSSAAYIGQDTLPLELETTLDCAKQTVRVKPVELFTLISGATPSSDNCAAASVNPTLDPESWSSIGQIRERSLSPSVEYFGGMRGAPVDTSGIAAFSAATTGMSDACLAYDTYGDIGYATGCVMPGPKVCATGDDIEAPFLDGAIANEALNFDDALLAKWDSMVFVSVWNNASPKKSPLAGATLQVAASEGQVVYVDPPAAGSTRLTRRTDNATGPSGLALVFTNRLAKVTVNAGSSSRDVTVAAPDWSFGAALVVMP